MAEFSPKELKNFDTREADGRIVVSGTPKEMVITIKQFDTVGNELDATVINTSVAELIDINDALTATKVEVEASYDTVMSDVTDAISAGSKL